ncbi:MAG: hypothetical protein ACP5K4_05855 [Caldisericum sp.]
MIGQTLPTKMLIYFSSILLNWIFDFWNLKVMSKSRIKASYKNFIFYYELHINTPNSKLLFHFPTKTFMIANEDFVVKRAMPVIVNKTNEGFVVRLETQKEKIFVELI